MIYNIIGCWNPYFIHMDICFYRVNKHKLRNQEEKINNGIIVFMECNANMSKSIFTVICIYCLYKGVHINLWFIWPLEISNLLVHWVLCGAKHNRRNSNTDHAVDTCRNFIQNIQWLCLIVYKFNFFLLIWCCSINIKYIYIVEKCEIYLYSTRGLLIFLFLQLAQVNFIFADKYVYFIYIASNCY